jgi:hypothetical protein
MGLPPGRVADLPIAVNHLDLHRVLEPLHGGVRSGQSYTMLFLARMGVVSVKPD